MPLLKIESVRGGWGRRRHRIYTFSADDDAYISCSGVWPPPFGLANNPAAPTVQVRKRKVGATYFVANYLVSFDTRSFRRGRHHITSATLLLTAVPSTTPGLLWGNPDNRNIECDAWPWGDVGDSADYVALDQPGQDGSISLVGAQPDSIFSLALRTSAVLLNGLSQLRLTISGDIPTGFNATTFFSKAGSSGPLLVVGVREGLPLWEMIGAESPASS